MKLIETIETFISGDWGNESHTEDTPCEVFCVRGADIEPIKNQDYNHIPKRYISKRSYENKLLQVGDIIVEKSGGSPTQSTGRVCLITPNLIEKLQSVDCSNFCAAFRVKKEWDAEYIYLYIQHFYNMGAFFNFEGKTSGIKNLQLEQAASMRKAMNLLIDREFIVENVGQTGQIAADSFVPAGMSDGNGGVFKTDDTSYYDADKTGADQVEEAKKLLESAGYTFTDNGDGSYKCDPAISMTFLTNDDSTHIAVGESLQQDFALLGINMEIKSEDWNVFIEDRKSGNFTIAREGWLADYNDPINMLELFTTDSGNNDMQLGKGDKPSDSAPDWTDYNKLIKEIRTTADFSKRVDLMHQAEDMLMDTGAVMPIYYYNDIYMLKSNIKGIYSTIYGMKYFMYATKDK